MKLITHVISLDAQKIHVTHRNILNNMLKLKCSSLTIDKSCDVSDIASVGKYNDELYTQLKLRHYLDRIMTAQFPLIHDLHLSLSSLGFQPLAIQ